MLEKLLIVYPIIFFAEGFPWQRDYQALTTAAKIVNNLADADLVWLCYMGDKVPFPLSSPTKRKNGFYEIGQVGNSYYLKYFNEINARLGLPPSNPDRKYYGMALIHDSHYVDRDILLNRTLWRRLRWKKKVIIVAHEMLHVLGWGHNDQFPNLMSSLTHNMEKNPHLDENEQEKWRMLIMKLTNEEEFKSKLQKASDITSDPKCDWKHHHGIKNKKEMRI